MTKEQFRKLTENILLLDGATGSNLMASGMPRGICTETWVIEHKEIFQELQRAYIAAGSQVIYAPTFGGNRINLAKHGLTDRIEEINRTLVGYSRELAGDGVYVAGDITTSGSLSPLTATILMMTLSKCIRNRLRSSQMPASI